MMRTIEYPKLSKSLVNKCKKNCMNNEMLIVPKGRDYGQFAYYRCKTEAVVTFDNHGCFYDSDEEERLLRFPGPDEERILVTKALDSVENFCSLSAYPRCIMFDVSAYAQLPDHRNILDLIEVMHDDYGFRCVFLLFSTSAGELSFKFERDLRMQTMTLDKPDERTMADYLEWLYEEPCDCYDDLILNHMSQFSDFEEIDSFMDFLEKGHGILSNESFDKWYAIHKCRSCFGY